MRDDINAEDTIESLRLQIEELNRVISLQEERIIRAEKVVSSRDKVTDRLRAERSAQDSFIKKVRDDITDKEEFIRIIFENAPVGLTVFDENFGFIDCNDAVLELYGISKESYSRLFGSDDHSPEHQPDGKKSHEKAREVIKQVIAGETMRIEWVHCLPGGELLPVELTMVRVKQGDKFIGLGYIYDMREQIRMRAVIEEALGQSQAANKAKSVFLANMSHEIRTPLNAIIGLSDLIIGTDDSLNEDTLYRLEQINQAGATLLSMVNDVLDLSKIEAGRFELIPFTYDTPSMINDAVTQSVIHKEDKQIMFTMNICDNLPTQLYGDELRIKQVLNNLLTNAFKYTIKGSVEFTVECQREEDAFLLTFIIKDTGIGIRKDDLNDLFSDYVQMDMEANRKIVGTGLGLPIAKRIIELMGGSITVESEYGVGSVFTVRIRQGYVTDKVIGAEVLESLRTFHYSGYIHHHKWEHLYLPYARVLIVDDIETNIDVARGLMKPYGMKIDSVLSGQEAIDAIHDDRVRYDAIFMDYMMPGMDGIEAAQRIREIGTDYAKNIPIIALTANAILGNEEMFLQKGFQAFVSKPIEFAYLDAVIREWVRDRDKEMSMGVEPEETISVAPIQSNDLGLQAFKGIPGLDVEKGLARFGNNKESYLAVMKSYVKNTPALLEAAVEAAMDEGRLIEYETIVHGVKGSSSAIFAKETAERAAALENAAKSGDYDYISDNNTLFIKATRELISAIEKVLEDNRKFNNKPIKDKPDAAILDRLAKACAVFDMNGVDEALVELEVFNYESGEELVEWLRENAEKANLDEMVERLKGTPLSK